MDLNIARLTLLSVSLPQTLHFNLTSRSHRSICSVKPLKSENEKYNACTYSFFVKMSARYKVTSFVLPPRRAGCPISLKLENVAINDVLPLKATRRDVIVNLKCFRASDTRDLISMVTFTTRTLVHKRLQTGPPFYPPYLHLHNFVKFLSILIIFGRKMVKRLKLCKVRSFYTSPNSRHHTIRLHVFCGIVV